jgi:hypothetical protein
VGERYGQPPVRDAVGGMIAGVAEMAVRSVSRTGNDLGDSGRMRNQWLGSRKFESDPIFPDPIFPAQLNVTWPLDGEPLISAKARKGLVLNKAECFL